MATTRSTYPVLSQIMLKALLNRFDVKGELLTYLSPAVAEHIVSRCTPAPETRFDTLLAEGEWLQTIHPSWALPYVQQQPAPLMPSYLSLFSPTARKGLEQTLHVQASAPSPFAKSLLLSHLKQALHPASITPHPLLSPSPLHELLTLGEKQLLTSIDFLGLHDLAAEVKHLVDKQMLDKLQAALTPMEQKFLAHCIKQVMPWVPPKLNLKGWDGSRATLHSLLHMRGLARLAKATRTQEVSFCWHLAHRLDMSRGNILLEGYKQPLDASLVPYFQKQLSSLLERLNS